MAEQADRSGEEVKPGKLLPRLNVKAWEPDIKDVVNGLTTAHPALPRWQDDKDRDGDGERAV